ncbi:cohesin domain-containing protein [Duganella rhizosphaerae]|uniref:cohesin domain-containing protein n=1 Tax=Duganella rhizosphaerae TaxID=2885763 RepID=UPI00403F6863
MTSMLIRALGALLAACCLQAAAGPILSILPSSPMVLPGQTFSATVAIENASDLFAYQFDLAFNPGLLRITNVTEGSFLPSVGPTVFFPGTIDNRAGQLAFTVGTLTDGLPGASGDGGLVRIDFQALGTGGISGLSLSNLILLNSSLVEIADASVIPGQVAVVPEPGTLLLLCSMVLGMQLALRRKPRH